MVIRQKIIENLNNGICISVITYSELMYGVYKSVAIEKNAKNLKEFAQNIEIVPFDEHCAEEYGKICAYLQKSGTPIGPMDMLIAAHAKAMGCIAVTNNTREFERVPGLKLEDWSE